MLRFILIFIMAFVVSLQADYVLKYEMDGEQQTYMYHSSSSAKMSISGNGENQEIYKIGKKIYIVSIENGKKSVMDLDKLKQMQSAMGFDASMYKQEIEQAKYNIRKTGKKLRVYMILFVY